MMYSTPPAVTTDEIEPIVTAFWTQAVVWSSIEPDRSDAIHFFRRR